MSRAEIGLGIQSDKAPGEYGRLAATAEAIAALAVVFVYLDVFAIRANNLFGAGSSDATPNPLRSNPCMALGSL